MCELLAMDCNNPTDLVFSFRGFSKRGGCTGPHGDGWGLAFFEGRAARVFLDPNACSASPLAEFFRNTPVKTLQALAHIRKKTRGHVKLANTHPFQRELWGRHWVFAHNGTLRDADALKLGRFRPVGTTDSEHAFCSLLEMLRATFRDEPADPTAMDDAIADHAGRLARLGTFNFVMGNGDRLFARCDTRLCHIVRRYPFGRATLKDDDVSIDFGAVTTPRDRVAVVATTPLTVDETWVHGDPATLWVFRRGRLLSTLPSGVPIARKVPRHLRATAATPSP